MYQIPVCSNSSRHIPDLEPLCPIPWGCSQHRDSPGETSPVLASPLPSSTSAAFPKYAPCPQQIMNNNIFKLTYVWGAFPLEYGKQPNQGAVQCCTLSRMNIPCMANVQALLEVHSPHSGVCSQKEPPFSSSSHLTQGLYWLADGFNKRNYLECLWALCEWGRSPLHLQPELYWKWTTDNWYQATVQCKRTKYKGRFSLFLNISNTAQKKRWYLSDRKPVFSPYLILTIIYRP